MPWQYGYGYPCAFIWIDGWLVRRFVTAKIGGENADLCLAGTAGSPSDPVPEIEEI